MKATKRILVSVVCAMLVLVTMTACGKKEENPFKGLVFDPADFRSVNMGTTIDVVKAFEKMEPDVDMNASEMGSLEGMDAATAQAAKQLRMHMLGYRNAQFAGYEDAELSYFFLKEKLAMATIGIEDAQNAVPLYNQMKEYYIGIYGTPAAETSEACQFIVNGKFLFITCNNKDITAIGVMDPSLMQ